MHDSVAISGSAFHQSGVLRRGHRRVRPLTAGESRADAGLTLVLRENPRGPSLAHTLKWLSAQPARQRRHLDTCQLAAEHGYADDDAERVARWAAASGMRVTAVDPATRRITVRGETTHLGNVFGVALERFSGPGPDGLAVEYRGYSGDLRVPAQLSGVLDGVFGLDDRPVARSHLHELRGHAPALVSYDPCELAEVYAFPRLTDGGAGLHLVAGMIELGGTVRAADVAASFARMGLSAPQMVDVSVDGAVATADPDGADVEVALDYQVLGAMVMQMAPRARLTIVIYNAPNHERGFVDAVAVAATDTAHRPAAVSISWGSPESSWTGQGMRAMNAAFAAGSARGVAFSASAGDWGSSNAEPDGLQHAEHPASSPHVWACGGTTLLATQGHAVSETVWNELAIAQGAAGSGVSAFFATPPYQAAQGIAPRSANDGRPGRGLPDGSGNADPVTGWNVLSAGHLRTTGGTSAVAPMYTALWTLVAALSGRPIGQPHATLYAAGGRCFNDVTRGSTGGPYVARRGWDAASGWGTPIGTRIARELDRGVVRGGHGRHRRVAPATRELQLA
jgi:kumamolisin